MKRKRYLGAVTIRNTVAAVAACILPFLNAEATARKKPASSSEEIVKTESTSPLAVQAPEGLNHTATDFALPAGGETTEKARLRVEKQIAVVQSIKCTVDFSKKREDKPTRKLRSGPLELQRGKGAHLTLTRKGTTQEYLANSQYLWSYDHKDKEATFIPTSLPIVDSFVENAFRLNFFMGANEATITLAGSETIDGERCWVFEGKTTDKMKSLGVPVSSIRVWISKKDGVARKITLPDENDTQIYLRDVSVNPQISESSFEFKAPKGVKTKNMFGF